MHIAVLSDGVTPFVTGGMQRHTFHLVRHLLSLGVDITLIHTVPYSSKMPSEAEVQQAFGFFDARLEVIAIPFIKRRRLPGHYIRESYRYSAAIAESLLRDISRFDFIYAKGFTAWHLLERKNRGAHLPPIGVNFHGYEMFQKAGSWRTKLEQYLFRSSVMFNVRKADVVFSYGGEITLIIEKIGVAPKRIAEIASGVDSAWIRNEISPSGGKRTFVFVGRPERRKGIADLRKALDTVPDDDFEMHWVGAIPAKYIRKGETAHGEIRDQTQLRDVLDRCDVLIAPSHAEGMPNVILEAMARGLAIIATPVGAVPVVVGGDNGLLVRPGNVADLSQSIAEVLHWSNAKLDAVKRENISTISARFSWDVVARQTLEAIKRHSYAAR